MGTAGARRAAAVDTPDTVLDRRRLRLLGVFWHDVDRQVRGGRWQLFGNAVLLHNAAPTISERRQIAVVNCGPRAVLTSFTSAEEQGLRGWERSEIHVLAPKGAKRPATPGLVLHRTGTWSRSAVLPARRLHRLAPSLVIAAGSFALPRPACGLLAAAVQQRLTTPDELRGALREAPRAKHRRALGLSLGDIAQGADALSEIDFTRLCARAGLPCPHRQAVRREPGGRRRYLDVEWELPGGRRRAVEVDGAHHTEVRRWEKDQLRQNEVVIGGTPVLRFPASLVRFEEEAVAGQLRRFLDVD